MSDIQNPALLQAVRELLEEIRKGRRLRIAESTLRPPYVSDELVAELQSRCPGYSRGEYESVIAGELLLCHQKPQRNSGSVWYYWPIAFTFIWGFLVAPLGLKKLWGWNEWTTVFGYPAICLCAAAYLTRANRQSHVAFALVNSACAVAWVAFAIGAFRAFAGNFCK